MMKKTKRDVALLTEFFQTKGETRSERAEIPLAELNELLSEFILRGLPIVFTNTLAVERELRKET